MPLSDLQSSRNPARSCCRRSWLQSGSRSRNMNTHPVRPQVPDWFLIPPAYVWVLIGFCYTHPSVFIDVVSSEMLRGKFLPDSGCFPYSDRIKDWAWIVIQESWISVSHRTQPSSVRLQTLCSSSITLGKCLQLGLKNRLMSSSDTDQMGFSRSWCEMRLGKLQNALKAAPLIGRRPVAEVRVCGALWSAFNWLTGAQTSWQGTKGLQLVCYQEVHVG